MCIVFHIPFTYHGLRRPVINLAWTTCCLLVDGIAYARSALAMPRCALRDFCARKYEAITLLFLATLRLCVFALRSCFRLDETPEKVHIDHARK
jgi:hypothetical protein